jgi:hypothetical protein
MEEKVYEVEMMYIQNTSGSDYTVETSGRRTKSVKLNFSNVEGVEINSPKPLEVKNSFIQMNDGQSKLWNMRFAYPTNLLIKYNGRIVIEAL